jgi:putative transposase
MVKKQRILSLSRQCRLLSIGRISVYYAPTESERTLDLMRRIDELYTEDPTYGARRICAVLRNTGVKIGRYKVRRLMEKMGLEAIYRKPKLSEPHPGHKVYPYLLRGVKVTRANQVWSTDITYIRLRRGFVYLTAVIDWYSRCVLSWRLSTNLDSSFCVDALEEAIERYGTPDVFNTDQGSQFTSTAFTSVLNKHGVKISMDGKGRALDNVFVERLWRTVKYEDVYLKEYVGVAECRAGMAAFFDRYNTRRPHQSLGYRYPKDVFMEVVTHSIAA